MKHTKQTAALLSALILLCTLSCGNAENPAEGTKSASSDSTPQTETEEDRSYLETLPDADFGGEDFRILAWDTPEAQSSLWFEKQTGDVLIDTVVLRNAAIEERYNLHFKVQTEDRENIRGVVRDAALSADGAFDFVSYRSMDVLQDAAQGYFLDLYSVSEIDLSNPWWDKESTETVSMLGKSYVAFSDMEVQPYNQLYGLFFNRDMIASYDLDDPYALVREGTWTIDRYREMCLAAARDVNNDGAMKQGDIFGTAEGIGSYIMLMLGCGEGLVIEDDGEYIQNYATERGISVLEKVCGIVNAAFTLYLNDMKFADEAFAAGELLFSNYNLDGLNTKYRGLTIGLGIVPMPKYDEEQKAYHTMQSNWSMGVSLLTSARDPRMSGIVVEALGAYSYKTLKQAFLEITLKDKLSRDPDMAEMIGLIIDSRFVDLGCFMENTWGTMMFRDLLRTSGAQSMTSYAEKYEPKFQKKIADMMEAFAGLN